ncbi:hypothetical protein ACZ75_05255 [Massilia sp. NR 4-1]|nr:hypothetical protein ACZ75_05255 [Massilia sp. NR 4-1]
MMVYMGLAAHTPLLLAAPRHRLTLAQKLLTQKTLNHLVFANVLEPHEVGQAVKKLLGYFHGQRNKASRRQALASFALAFGV